MMHCLDRCGRRASRSSRSATRGHRRRCCSQRQAATPQERLCKHIREDRMRLASYNVENLFMRARAMNGDTRDEGADALAAHAEMNTIIAKPKYSAQDKKKLVQLMTQLKIDKKDDGGPFVIL